MSPRRRTVGIVLASLASLVVVALGVVAVGLVAADADSDGDEGPDDVAVLVALAVGAVVAAAWAMPRRRILLAAPVVAVPVLVLLPLWVKHLAGW